MVGSLTMGRKKNASNNNANGLLLVLAYNAKETCRHVSCTATLGFQALISKLCVTKMINHIFTSFPAVQIYEFSYIHLYSSPSTGILGTHEVASSQLA